MVLDAEGAEELTPPGDALVLIGHQIVHISTPNFRPPTPELKTGSMEADIQAVIEAIKR